ncbi:hypothetical protein Tco_0216037 [Tanacetum coccineum]
MNASGIQNNEEMVNLSRQKLKQKRGEKEQRTMNAKVSRKSKQTLGQNKEKGTINARGSQNNEGMVDPSHQKLKQMLWDNKGLPLVGNQEQRKINASGIHNNEEMISDYSMKSKNTSRIWYSGSGPGKGAFERLDSQNPSTNNDRHPINKERGYLEFQDKELKDQSSRSTS